MVHLESNREEETEVTDNYTDSAQQYISVRPHLPPLSSQSQRDMIANAGKEEFNGILKKLVNRAQINSVALEKNILAKKRK